VEILEEAIGRLKLGKMEGSVKGVKGLINKTRMPEPLEKALLRAKSDVSVFKDGTLRFDASNAVLTQFKPGEIGLSLEKAHEIGYAKDMDGHELSDSRQLCALEIQDLVVSEACGEYLLKVSRFLDDLLSSYYGIDKLYKASKREDLIGHLVVGLSPHTSVGAVGRIVGFTKASVCYAHPLYHAAKRRDCDGDEDSVSLLLDVLLNFSREYLPDRIGGLMDAPLLLAPLLNATEVARQAFNIETITSFPIAFYEKTLVGANPKDIEDLVPTLNNARQSSSGNWNIGFTHPTEDLDRARLTSAYKELPTMLEKVKEQLDLADKIVAVKGEEVARKVLGTHILRDLVGNLRTFTSQRSRCSKCNWKPRRPPLKGVCVKCGGKLGPTVFKAGVEKYLQVAFDMVKRYNVGEYYRQRLDLIKVELDETFRPAEEDRTQTKLLVGDFA
jgi:DNA polymerase II large subunit